MTNLADQFLDFVSASAVSFVVSGNTGVAPFLTLFLIGTIERANPDLLNMSGNLETLLSSPVSLVVLGSLTLLEFVSMCIPVVDEVVDSIMTFVVPVFSAIGSVSTFGLFELIGVEADDDTETGDGSGRRELLGGSSGNIGGGLLIFFQVILVVIGIVLALSIHGLKMLVRLIGEGWLTYCLTVMEAMWICMTITLAIFIRPIAILIAACVCLGAVYSIKKNYFDKRRNRLQQQQQQGQQEIVTQLPASLPEQQQQTQQQQQVMSESDYVKMEEPPMAQVIAVDDNDDGNGNDNNDAAVKAKSKAGKGDDSRV